MSDLIAGFQGRLAEVNAYLEFLATIECRAQHGPPRLEGADSPITTQQQRILYSSVYLQLYNLVEATMSGCIDAVAAAARHKGRWTVADLSEELRREWVRSTARTHVHLSPQGRLDCALALCEHLVASLPIQDFEIEQGAGGNWDDKEIEKFSKRLGCRLDVSPPVYSAVKRPFRDDLGPLALVRDLRNRLAHGSISFAECSEDATVERLTDLTNRTVNYLSEVVACFGRHVESAEYLTPEKRPA